MSVDCNKDINHKVAAFTMYMNSNQETGHNLTTENLELLSKFAEFLKADKMGKHKDERKRGHGKFGKHEHHGMFRHHHHFGKHGPFGKHGHGHRHNHHGNQHSGGRQKFKNHGFRCKQFSPEFHGKQRHIHSPETFAKHGKHHKKAKHFWKWAVFHEVCKNVSGECPIANGRNSSVILEESTPPGEEVPFQASDENCSCVWQLRHCGWRGHCVWQRNRGNNKTAHSDLATTTQSTQPTENPQTNTNSAPQENLERMVELISIESSPSQQEA